MILGFIMWNVWSQNVCIPVTYTFTMVTGDTIKELKTFVLVYNTFKSCRSKVILMVKVYWLTDPGLEVSEVTMFLVCLQFRIYTFYVSLPLLNLFDYHTIYIVIHVPFIFPYDIFSCVSVQRRPLKVATMSTYSI